MTAKIENTTTDPLEYSKLACTYANFRDAYHKQVFFNPKYVCGPVIIAGCTTSGAIMATNADSWKHAMNKCKLCRFEGLVMMFQPNPRKTGGQISEQGRGMLLYIHKPEKTETPKKKSDTGVLPSVPALV